MDTAAASKLFTLTDRELWIVTASDRPRRGGLVATFVCVASLVDELPRMLIALSKQHYTRELIEASNAFGLHLISAGQLDWVSRFGLQTGREADKLSGLAIETGITGAPLLRDAIGWLDCRVEDRMDTGDRTVYLAEVVDARVNHDEPPLTMNQLLRIAPPERLQELKQLRERDSQVDAQAILAWRKMRSERHM